MSLPVNFKSTKVSVDFTAKQIDEVIDKIFDKYPNITTEFTIANLTRIFTFLEIPMGIRDSGLLGELEVITLKEYIPLIEKIFYRIKPVCVGIIFRELNQELIGDN